MKRPAYPKYKPSGVEWLGDVPGHWEVKRGRFVARVNPPAPRLRILQSEDEVSFVPMEALGVDGGMDLSQTRIVADVTGGYTEFQDGDVVVAKITPCFENGKAALASQLVNGAAYGTTELHVLRAKDVLTESFLFYVVVSDTFRKLGESEMYGAGGQKRVPAEFAKDFRIPLPPLPEQRAIAAFLDRETGRIDTLVAKKRELIERLKEKRTALISRTVTRGLPPEAAAKAGVPTNPPLKPSGLDWLGEIPEHWDSVMLKRTWKICQYGISESLSGDGPIRVLTMGNIQDGRVLIPDDGCVDDVADDLLLRNDDLLFNRTNSIVHVGKVGLYKGDPAVPVTFASYLVRLHPNRRAVSGYMAYLLNTTHVLEMARSLALPSINQANLNPTRYGQMRIPLPPVEEQRAIATYLATETAKLDALVAKVEEAVERLQEYRTALITAAVTGKIDVRKVTTRSSTGAKGAVHP